MGYYIIMMSHVVLGGEQITIYKRVWKPYRGVENKSQFTIGVRCNNHMQLNDGTYTLHTAHTCEYGLTS